jgi:YidC/Oxa1 family membrane protein insertase
LTDFQNPQNEPGTEKRLLLVFALTFVVILLFQPLLKKYLPQPPVSSSQNQPAAPMPAGQTTVAPAQPSGSSKPEAIKQANAETEIVVENDLYRITFTNRGGQVKSWVLKMYDDDRGKPLDLVNNAAAAKYGYPLSLWTYDETLRNKLNNVLYVPSSSGTLSTPGSLTFEYADQGLTVRKTFRFDQTYVVHVDTSLLSNGNSMTAFLAWPAGFGDQSNLAAYHSAQIEYQNDSDTQRLDIKKISGGATIRGPFDWAGVGEPYFAAVFLPDDVQSASLVTLRNRIDVPKDPQKPNETTPVDVLGAAAGNISGETSARMYVGPKSLRVLESIPVPGIQGAAHDLRSLLNFGFFGPIARVLFLWLRWTYEHWIPNWGWAIVIQTFIITMALVPLRISSMKSALKMQKVAPQAKAIQEKYKKYSMRDPRKQDMQKEISELYKSEGVNPVGGCLPLLIQLPFMWAYYKILQGAIDLRHAHWLWVHDLSARDPYFLLPLFMVAGMFLIQKMTPQAGMDPAQQKMMNFMPLFTGFIFFNLAAGLNLYYAEVNLIQVAQQLIMNRTSLGREMREMALKRARKKGK